MDYKRELEDVLSNLQDLLEYTERPNSSAVYIKGCLEEILEHYEGIYEVDNKQARKYVDNGTFKIVESLLQKAV